MPIQYQTQNNLIKTETLKKKNNYYFFLNGGGGID